MFVLRYYEGFDNKEIAALMKTSPLVVGVVLHRARTKLKKEIGHYLEKHHERIRKIKSSTKLLPRSATRRSIRQQFQQRQTVFGRVSPLRPVRRNFSCRQSTRLKVVKTFSH